MTEERAEDIACPICDGDVTLLSGFSDLPRVTSDCKPMRSGGKLAVCMTCGSVHKPADETWRAEIEEIYGGYEIYHLTDDDDQPIFNASGEASPRSDLLLDVMLKNASLEPHGRLIDIGCGSGAALARMSAGLPQWELNGCELSSSALPRLQRLPNFKELFVCPIESIPGSFDLVTMIHSLEHMPDVLGTLASVKKLIGQDGTLFVEVPDLETSPFDLVVSDHRMHFTTETLSFAVNKSGYAVSHISNRHLPKEISLLAKAADGESTGKPNGGPDGEALARRTVDWLSSLLSHARSTAQKAKRFGVFGTSVSGMWLFGGLRDEVDFFVDEDPGRIGSRYEGRPILAPADVEAGTVIYVPLVPDVARRVAGRLARTGVDYVVPPPFGASHHLLESA